MPPVLQLIFLLQGSPSQVFDWFPTTSVTHHMGLDLASFTHYEDYHGANCRIVSHVILPQNQLVMRKTHLNLL